jgi:hypothetical protein
MDRKTYARMVLDDRKASSSFWRALRRSIGGRNLFPVILMVCVFIGAIWIYTDMFPAVGGFLIGAACGCSALLIMQIKDHLRHRSLTEQFVDWKKVEEIAEEEV